MAGLETNHWDFCVAGNDDLVCIKKGPTTGSGKTELHRLSASDNYQKYSLQTGTGLHLSTGSDFAFALTAEEDLVCIKMGPSTGCGKTEVHILSKASNYQTFTLQTPTPLHITNHREWAFVMDSFNDLLCIKRGPNTGSKKTEVHRLSAASKYQKFNLQTGSGIHLTHFPGMGYWKFAVTRENDLACIGMGPKTGTKKTEYHVLSRSSNYTQFNVHLGTALHYTDPQTRPWAWNFGLASGNDLVCIGRGPTTGSGMTEVHKLSAASKYSRFNLHIATCLHITASLVKTEEEPKIPVPEGCEVPAYWENKDLSSGFDEIHHVDPGFVAKLQELLDSTFKEKATRDRTQKMPASLKVRMCHRIEDARMWIRYFEARKALEAREDRRKLSDENPVKTGEWAKDNSYGDSMDDSVNELLLMHGSSPQGVVGISSDGFRRSLAGTNAGSMFTAGCYLAECCSKADEYAKTDDTFYEGLCAMLLCRTACGQLFTILKPDHEAIQAALTTGAYDSVLGDREAAVGTYREFVIFNEQQVYPEYVLLYERVHDDMGEGEDEGYENGYLGRKMREAVERGTEGDESKILAIFREWDKDGNGSISKSELIDAMSKVCTGLTPHSVETLVNQVDRNGDGVIDYEEFLAFLGF